MDEFIPIFLLGLVMAAGAVLVGIVIMILRDYFDDWR